MMRKRAMVSPWLMASTLVAVPIAPSAAQSTSVVYLARHAETDAEASDPRNPGLSTAGASRAEGLADVIPASLLTSVHSTDLRRTRETATPAAEAAGLELRTYDPFDEAGMADLVARLRTTPGHHLVVGHSNTTPTFVHALGGDPVAPIHESEYDRLYIVMSAPEHVGTTVLRYGPPSGGLRAFPTGPAASP